MIKIISKEIISKGKFSSYMATRFLDQNGNERRWEWFSKKDVAVILPITKDGNIVCISNYRIPIEAKVIELPAGLVDSSSSLEQIKKELLEETGYACEKITQLGRFPMNAGMTNNFVTYYVGTDTSLSQDGQHLEESEDIDVKIMPPKELENLRDDKNIIVDPGIFSLIYLAQSNGYLKK